MARPVGGAENASTLVAAQALNYEWARLRNKKVWGEDHPRDWADVRQAARTGGYVVHMDTYAEFALRNSEMEAYKKYKGRLVLCGNAGADQYHDKATVRDMGS